MVEVALETLVEHSLGYILPLWYHLLAGNTVYFPSTIPSIQASVAPFLEIEYGHRRTYIVIPKLQTADAPGPDVLGNE